ncbi:MAG: ROK family protein [Candidatus Omnitrophica bacterium]|nr:ROK family protein [Candidatus Omnitrophota bacterium]
MSYFIGIDIGGTKMAGAVVTSQGRILHRSKISTPTKGSAKGIFLCLVDLIEELRSSLSSKSSKVKGIGPACGGIGLGVPGIVDTHKEVGIFPGTGVGGAVLINGRLLLGIQGAATELGHMVMQVDGPLCHCGNRGCLEALTSRWAMERDIRSLIKSGHKSIVKELNNGSLATIKSRVLKEALQNNDPVVKKVFKQTSSVLGQACVCINHIFNPQAIVLGGGVIKACGFFMLPIIEKNFQSDPFFKSFNRCRILQSSLGDDAVVLGAVRLVKSR